MQRFRLTDKESGRFAGQGIVQVSVVEHEFSQPWHGIVSRSNGLPQFFPGHEVAVSDDGLAHGLQFTQGRTLVSVPVPAIMPSMPKVGFIVNPKGGGGSALAAWERIHETFPAAAGYFTTRPGDGEAQALLARSDGCDVVCAVGGDGTVSEVASALVHTETVLGIIPAGTGNDYAKSLAIPRDPVEAARMAYGANFRLVDVGKALSHREFVNIAGVGFDAEVMTRFNSPGLFAKRMPVKVRYYLSILKTFAQYRGVKAILTIDGEVTVVDNLLLLAIGCAQFYGAGMHILPMADLSDGLFDLAWGFDVKLSELNKLMVLIYKGEHVDHPNVKFARCKGVVVETDPETRFHLDGDVTGKSPVTFECVPHALRVVAGHSE